MSTKTLFAIGMICSFIACPGVVRGQELNLVDSFKIRNEDKGFSEPSGLSRSSNDGRFWSVSDADARLHLLEADGTIVNAFHLPKVSGTDLEGVASRPDGSVVLVQEKAWTLVVVEPGEPPTVERFALREMSGFASVAPLLEGNPANKGPEGITTDPVTGSVFVVIEGQPRLLLEISEDLTEILNATMMTSEMGFVAPHADDEKLDLSGLAWSQSSGSLWILSDTGRRIFVFDLKTRSVDPIDLVYEHKGKKKTIRNAEGIALDEAKGLLFVLTDDGKKSRLFVFSLS